MNLLKKSVQTRRIRSIEGISDSLEKSSKEILAKNRQLECYFFVSLKK
jgi:hypothetical protein